MKKILLILLLLITIISAAKTQDTIRVGAFNFYPGIFMDSDGLVKGFYVDALNEIGEKENIVFEYVYGSWDQGLIKLENEEVDILTSVAFTKDRAEIMDYSQSALLTVWSEVYVGKGSKINGILDLEGKKIAIMKSDYNGGYLKNLTLKLDINCEYIETGDFEQVFNLISNNEVDAGVVNITFGAAKSEDYNVLTSGIILNPFDIYLAAKKGKNKETLELLDDYLLEWKNDRSSIFNIARQKWSHKNVGSIEVFPEWIKQAIYMVFSVVLILILFIVLLRYKVKQVTEKKDYSERQFKTFMDNTPAFVYIKDSKLNHIYRNRMVNEVNSVPDSETNSSAKTIFEPQIAEFVEKTDRKILHSHHNLENIQYRCLLNGKSLWLHDYKFFLKLPNNESAVGGISFDITKLKETEIELIKAKEKAEQSDRLKSAFLANMSHEIRTPMNGIIGFAELLKERNLNNELQKQYVDIIIKSGDRMLNIINDIVDISKIESGLMKVYNSELQINQVMDDLFGFFSGEANNKNLKLSLEKGLNDSRDLINTDSDKFFAILSNLLKNAIKYTDEGQIEFGYKLIPENKELEFYVKDTGIGIPQDKQEVIFERFIQADIEDKMARQGAGLGLAITNAYVDLLGGRISLESNVGKGSTFYFAIPYDDTIVKIENQEINNTDKKEDKQIGNLNVLIGEDDHTSSMLIEIEMKEYCNNIFKAYTGSEVVEVCKMNPDLDLIFMDINMPIYDGYEATRKIREFNKDIIIIAQTAYSLVGDREKALAAGCNDYISKPILKNKLLELINLYFDK